MEEHRNLARELSLMATEVDSLEKARVLAQGERDREAKKRAKAETDARNLRAELEQARRRAKAAERALAELSSSVDVSAHQAETNERELKARLDDAEQAKKVLRHEVEQSERERRAMEVHLKEVLGNLRSAAQEAQRARAASEPDEATMVTVPRDVGW
jgi:multidrug efflux pump subunit AcrA (membrane-fusion protein)